jgi:serine/threonine protein kinase
MESYAFEIDKKELLGKGGTSFLYAAYNKYELKKSVKYAAKKIPEETKIDNSVLSTFNNELLISSDLNLDHPNLVKFYGIHEYQNESYMVYEYCNGGDLNQFLKEYYNINKKSIGEKEIKKILKDLLTALTYLHKNKIVHHDIKPGNVLLKYNTEEDKKNLNIDNCIFKISDFGFSKYIDELEYQLSGTKTYMDPLPLIYGKKELYQNVKFDIWSLGILTYKIFFDNIHPFMQKGKDISMQILKDNIIKREYFINIDKYSISKELICFIDSCLKLEQIYRKSSEELLFYSQFINEPFENFHFVNKDNLRSEIPEKFIENNQIKMNIEINEPIEKYLKFDQKYKIKSKNGNDFVISLKISNKEFILFEAINEGKRFTNTVSMEQFHKHEYLNNFNDIQCIMNEFQKFLESQKLIIIEEENKIILSFDIKISNFDIYLLNENNKTSKNNGSSFNSQKNNELLNDLMKIIDNQKNEIKILKEEIDKIKKSHQQNIEFLKNRIEDQEKKIKSFEEFKNKKEEEDNLKNQPLSLNSLILNNNEKYIYNLKNWINPYSKIKSDLLYRMTKDGETFKIFHELCDNKGPTLTLIKIKNGEIIGGFTPISWDCSSNWKNDINSFIFSLTQNKKFMKNNNLMSIYCNKDNGPWFDDFGFDNNTNKKNMKECYFGNINLYENGNEIIKDKKGRILLEVTEVEIFKITFYCTM